jgi:hypothetical protein
LAGARFDEALVKVMMLSRSMGRLLIGCETVPETGGCGAHDIPQPFGEVCSSRHFEAGLAKPLSLKISSADL